MKSLIVGLIALVTVAGCMTDADVASHNLSKAADMFEADNWMFEILSGDVLSDIWG